MWKRVVVCGVAISLLAGITPAASADPAGGETAWHPSYRQVGAPMLGVAATGRNSAWAISYGWRRWVLHWNGHRWMHVTLPARFYAISVAASGWDNVWVCGQDEARDFVAYLWGGSGWARVPVPDGAGCDFPAVLGLRDIWVPGWTTINSQTARVVWHWNGGTWTVRRLPRPISAYSLSSSPHQPPYLVGRNPQTGRLVAYRWNSAAWRPLRLPHLPITRNPHISIASPRNIWVVAPHGGKRSVVLHWNGSRWRSIRVPWWAPAGATIAAAGKDRAWLGSTALWNGRTWLMGTPNPMSSYVAVVPGTRSTWVAFADTDGRHELGRIDYNGPKP